MNDDKLYQHLDSIEEKCRNLLMNRNDGDSDCAMAAWHSTIQAIGALRGIVIRHLMAGSQYSAECEIAHKAVKQIVVNWPESLLECTDERLVG